MYANSKSFVKITIPLPQPPTKPPIVACIIFPHHFHTITNQTKSQTKKGGSLLLTSYFYFPTQSNDAIYIKTFKKEKRKEKKKLWYPLSVSQPQRLWILFPLSLPSNFGNFGAFGAFNRICICIAIAVAIYTRYFNFVFVFVVVVAIVFA